ncbi:MAG: sulfatase-like hydrolase/transferase, partial [Phycisphaeraceae bacterium]
MPHDAPNILILMTDQHSPRQLGCYGDPLVRTPHLDRLAEEGMRFDNTYCPSPLCVPSRMSFMTGRRPSRTGLMLNQSILPSGIPTWAHHMAIAGYETSLIGRMHFEGPDQRHGFMNRPIGENSAKHPGAPELGGPRYTKLPRATAGQNRPVFEHAGCGPSFYQYQDRAVTDRACEYLHAHADADADQPFAAVVGYMLPHCPFIGPKDAFEYYFDKVELPAFGDEPASTQQMYADRHLMDPPATEHQMRVAIAAYYAEALAGLPLRLPELQQPPEDHAWHLFVVQLELERLRIYRDGFIAALAEHGIGASVHFTPLHGHRFWRSALGLRPEHFPVADAAGE